MDQRGCAGIILLGPSTDGGCNPELMHCLSVSFLHLLSTHETCFDDDGTVLVSSQMDILLLQRLGIEPQNNVGAFTSEQKGYLKYHRLNTFKA